MSDTGIPEAVRRFVGAQINSLEQLEVLLLLWRSAEQAFSVPAISRQLGSSLMSIQGRLDDLTAARLVVRRDCEAGPVYQYSPEDPRVRAIVDGVAEAYKVRRLAVIDLVYGKPSSDIRSFSEAFRLTRKQEGS